MRVRKLLQPFEAVYGIVQHVLKGGRHVDTDGDVGPVRKRCIFNTFGYIILAVEEYDRSVFVRQIVFFVSLGASIVVGAPFHESASNDNSIILSLTGNIYSMYLYFTSGPMLTKKDFY